MDERQLPCPFVYANGKRCAGHVFRWRLYGGATLDRARKVRLWCSEKGNHAGILHTHEAKQRMEFYPDELPEAIADAIRVEEASEREERGGRYR